MVDPVGGWVCIQYMIVYDNKDNQGKPFIQRGSLPCNTLSFGVSEATNECPRWSCDIPSEEGVTYFQMVDFEI